MTKEKCNAKNFSYLNQKKKMKTLKKQVVLQAAKICLFYAMTFGGILAAGSAIEFFANKDKAGSDAKASAIMGLCKSTPIAYIASASLCCFHDSIAPNFAVDFNDLKDMKKKANQKKSEKDFEK